MKWKDSSLSTIKIYTIGRLIIPPLSNDVLKYLFLILIACLVGCVCVCEWKRYFLRQVTQKAEVTMIEAKWSPLVDLNWKRKIYHLKTFYFFLYKISQQKIYVKKYISILWSIHIIKARRAQATATAHTPKTIISK